MKLNMRSLYTIFTLVLLLAGYQGNTQVTVRSSDSVTCFTPSTTLTATMVGDNPTNSGITVDDFFAPAVNPIGFTFNFYGTNYTTCLIGPNGNICFNTALVGLYTDYVISAPLLGNPTVLNTICGPWCDIFIPAGGTITYSTDGFAPFRKYSVTFCATAMYSCTTQYTNTQIILYETSNIIEVHVGHKDICAWNGGYAIIGVQNATGTAATVAPGRDFPSVYTCTNEAWRFTPVGGGTSYTVASIPYATIPLASSSIYWYDAGTGAYLGTGATKVVSPTTATTYKAGAKGCADTSFGFYNVTVNGAFPITTTFTQPTRCGAYDGTITINGLTAGLIDTLKFTYNGIPQPTLIRTVGPGGTIQLSGLCAGVYTSIIVKEGFCSSVPAAVTLNDPPMTIGSVTKTDPSTCGVSDGTLTLAGMYPSQGFTISYNYNGAPATPVPVTSSGTGDVTLTGLCAGIYDNIVASFPSCVGSCTTPAVGPITLTSPPMVITTTSDTDATACGVCDGKIVLNGMYVSSGFSVTYKYNGVLQAAISLTSDATGQLVITGLCEGVYDSVVAKYVGCETCLSPVAGPFTILAPPPVPLILVGSTRPTECGICDGSIKITSMRPYTADTVSYTLNGIPQLPIVTYSLPDSSIVLTGLCPGTYTSFYVKVGPCLHTVTGSAVLDTQHIHVDFANAIHYGCPKDTVYFTNWSTNTGPLYYTWRFGDTAISNFANTKHVYAQGVYTVTLVATNHYCTDSLERVIVLNNPIRAGFSKVPLNGIVCQGQPVIFTDSSLGINRNLNWSFGNGDFSTASDPIYTYRNSGVYRVKLTVTDFVPCLDTFLATIYVDSIAATRLAVSDTVFCHNTGVTFEGHYTSIGLNGVTWDFGDGDSILNVNPVSHDFIPGIYKTTLMTHYRACRDTNMSQNITVLQGPDISLGPDTSICPGNNSIVLKDEINAGNRKATWRWNTGQTTPAITITAPGNYYTKVSLNGCDATDSVLVKNDCYISIPNVFTPNGDGINDYFFPRQYLTMGLTAFKMDIFNRWGQLIFESVTTDGKGWDGSFNGTQQPEGVFIYSIDATFKDGQHEHHQGNVTLLR